MAIKVKKFGSREEAQASSEKGASGSGLVWGIPKEGCTVRFLTNSDGMIKFQEYFDEDMNAYVPVDEDDDLPEGARPSWRYLANVLWRSEGGAGVGTVVALKVPLKVSRKLFAKEKRYDGLTDRDYEFTRIGAGRDTEYDCDALSPERMALKKYTLLDLVEIITNEHDRVLGMSEDAEAEAAPKKTGAAKAPAKKAAAKGKKSLGAMADDDDDEAVNKLTELAEEVSLDPDDFDTWVELEEAIAAAEEGGADDAAAEALGEQADNDDDDAIAKLTELAEEAGLDPDDFDTWTELEEALNAAEETPDAEEAGGDEEDLDALGESADDDDDDAVARLTELAEEAGLDPDDFDTWAELATALSEAAGGEEAGEELEIDLDDLKAMSIKELRELADSLELNTRTLTTPAKLIAAIVKKAEG